MDEIEGMRKAIIEAVNKNEVSKRDLGNIATINKIIEGVALKDNAIRLAYSKLDKAREKLMEKNPGKVKAGQSIKVKQYNKVEQNEKEKEKNQEHKTKTIEIKNKNHKQKSDDKVKQYNKVKQIETQSIVDIPEKSKTIQQNKVEQTKIGKNEESIMNEIQDMKSTMNELRDEIETLKSTIANMQKSKTKNPSKGIIREQNTIENLMGFSIRIENTWTQGNRYEKYYAVKRIAGKLHRIYIGDDAGKAEEKIKSYCEKKGITVSMA